jgi:Chaperone of endosialidase
MNPLIQLKKATPIFLVTFLWFGFLPTAKALLPPPPPDGGYPNQNTAAGDFALFNLTTGLDNTANGFQALFNNTFGSANTASGSLALYSNTTGNDNTATGRLALFFNDTGNNNTATGFGALFGCSGGECGPSTGSNNTATGTLALLGNVTGTQNTATGTWALVFNTTGSFNTADGFGALLNNTTGAGNIALGNFAGSNLTIGYNNIDIGNPGVAGEANAIRIGTLGTQTATYIAGIMGRTSPRGTPVFINANGQLGTVTSSARFKHEVKPMDKASEAILALKPVTFRYKKEVDADCAPQFGLVAEDVEKIKSRPRAPRFRGKNLQRSL